MDKKELGGLLPQGHKESHTTDFHFQTKLTFTFHFFFFTDKMTELFQSIEMRVRLVCALGHYFKSHRKCLYLFIYLLAITKVYLTKKFSKRMYTTQFFWL